MLSRECFYRRDLKLITADLDSKGVRYTVVAGPRWMLTPQGPGKPWKWKKWRVYRVVEVWCD